MQSPSQLDFGCVRSAGDTTSVRVAGVLTMFALISSIAAVVAKDVNAVDDIGRAEDSTNLCMSLG